MLDCPKCTGALHQVDYNDEIHLHRCDICFGLWCEQDMLGKMKAGWMLDVVLDVGNPHVGRELNHINRIACPAGHGEMQATKDPDQPHIRYEQCNHCKGVFLDAGEFTDLKHVTPADWVRDLFAHLKGT